MVRAKWSHRVLTSANRELTGETNIITIGPLVWRLAIADFLAAGFLSAIARQKPH